MTQIPQICITSQNYTVYGVGTIIELKTMSIMALGGIISLIVHVANKIITLKLEHLVMERTLGVKAHLMRTTKFLWCKFLLPNISISGPMS
jgi:hypothetical protein